MHVLCLHLDCRGMNYLHNELSDTSIIHRDLKSSNILLAKVHAACAA